MALIYCCGMLYIQMKEKKAGEKPIVSSAIFFEKMKDAYAGKPLFSAPQVVCEFLIGWALAMGIAFGLRALSWPLAAILVGPFAAFAGVGLLVRWQNRHAATSHSSPR